MIQGIGCPLEDKDSTEIEIGLMLDSIRIKYLGMIFQQTKSRHVIIANILCFTNVFGHNLIQESVVSHSHLHGSGFETHALLTLKHVFGQSLFDVQVSP